MPSAYVRRLARTESRSQHEGGAIGAITPHLAKLCGRSRPYDPTDSPRQPRRDCCGGGSWPSFQSYCVVSPIQFFAVVSRRAASRRRGGLPVSAPSGALGARTAARTAGGPQPGPFSHPRKIHYPPSTPFRALQCGALQAECFEALGRDAMATHYRAQPACGQQAATAATPEPQPAGQGAGVGAGCGLEFECAQRTAHTKPRSAPVHRCK